MSIKKMRIIVFEDAAGEWRWHAKERKGRIMADSGEGYASKSNAKRAATRFQRLIADAEIVIES